MIPSSRRSRELHPTDGRELAEEDQQLWDTTNRDQSPDDV
jgi:hypothetical protein